MNHLSTLRNAPATPSTMRTAAVSRASAARDAAAVPAAVPVAPLARALLAAAAAVLLALLALFGAPAAFAHDSLISSTPQQGATVTEPLDSVVLSFSGELKTIGTQVSLVDAKGEKHAAEAAVSRNELTVEFPAALPNGEYTLTWRTVSSDGHPIEGTTSNRDALAFTVKDPAAGAATESASGSDTAAASAAATSGPGATDAMTSPAPASDAMTSPAPASDAARGDAATAEADAGEATGLFSNIPPALGWIVLALAILGAAAVVLAKVRRQTK